MGDLSNHFSRSEMKCHCGCDRCELDQALLPALEDFRMAAGAPVIVIDAYRCPKHNAEVGGVPDSEHLLGMAADVRIGGKSLQELYDLAESVPAFRMGGIGVYDGGFIHVDTRDKKTRWARVKGQYMSISASGLLTRW